MFRREFHDLILADAPDFAGLLGERGKRRERARAERNDNSSAGNHSITAAACGSVLHL